MAFCVRRRRKMLCLWIYLFLASGTYAQNEDIWCIIPPDDVVKNGKFVVNDFSDVRLIENQDRPAAGSKFDTYDLEFECDPGFFLRGNPFVRCVPAELGEFPECTATCDPSHPACSAPTDRLTDNLDGLTELGLECGMMSAPPSALAGGKPATPGDVPWQAAIYDKSTSPFMQICGGSIVSKDVVISAAHCFKLPDEFYAVAVGKIYRPYNNPRDKDAQKSDILEIRVPTRYRGSLTSFQDDIAAVILATPIQFTDEILPVCLHFGTDFDEVQVAPGKLGRVAGWGIDSQDGRPSQVLNLAELPMVDISTCFALQDESFVQYITSDKICAGYNNGTSVCKGDSGGGLAVPQKSGYIHKYYLRGVVSTGPPPALANECNVNAVTTFTRVAKHEFFVKSAIAKKPLQDSERRVPPIIPANINLYQNRLGNGGRVPEKVTSNQIGTLTNQIPVIGNTNDPQTDAPDIAIVNIPDTLTINGNINAQSPVRNDPVPQTGNKPDLQRGAPGTVVDIPDTLTTDSNTYTQVPLREDSVQQTGTNGIPSFGNSHNPQAQAPGTVLVTPDTSTTDSNRNTQGPPRHDSVQQTGDNGILSFGNNRDPQAQAHGTVLVIPNTLTTDSNRNTKGPLREDSVQQTGANGIPSFGNSHDPQAQAPGTGVVIPDSLTTDSNRNKQVPLIGDPGQQLGFNQIPLIENNPDPQRDASGTVVVVPDTLIVNDGVNTQDPERNDPVQQIDTNRTPVFGNIRDPQADAPGTVVVIPNTFTTDRNTQDLIRDNPVVQTGNNHRPVFGNNPDPQRDAPGTVLIIPDTLTLNDNIKTQDPLREDSVKPGILSDSVEPIDIIDVQKPMGHNHDQNIPTPGTEAITPESQLNDGIKNDEIRVEGSFVRNPVTSIDNNGIGPTGFNKNKVSIETTHVAIAPLADKIEVTSDGLTGVTTPDPPVQSAPQFPSWPLQYHNPNYNNWHLSNHNRYYPNQNKHQNPHNGYFGHDWHYSHPVWNSHNHHDFHFGHW